MNRTLVTILGGITMLALLIALVFLNQNIPAVIAIDFTMAGILMFEAIMVPSISHRTTYRVIMLVEASILCLLGLYMIANPLFFR